MNKLEPLSPPVVLAHRGLHEDTDENSLAAFRAAERVGVRWIETDARTTADGVAVLIHDPDLRRVAGVDRKVSELTRHEINQIRMKHGERIPSLEEILEAFPGMQFNIDLKDEASAETVPAVIARVHAWDRVRIASFSDARRHHALTELSRRWARAAGYGVGMDREEHRAALKLIARARTVSSSPGATAIGLFRLVSVLPVRLVPAAWTLVQRLAGEALPGFDTFQIPRRYAVGPVRIPLTTRRFVRAAHACGLRVDTWTIDDAAEMRELVGRGVDGIISNQADLALSLFPQRF